MLDGGVHHRALHALRPPRPHPGGRPQRERDDVRHRGQPRLRQPLRAAVHPDLRSGRRRARHRVGGLDGLRVRRDRGERRLRDGARRPLTHPPHAGRHPRVRGGGRADRRRPRRRVRRHRVQRGVRRRVGRSRPRLHADPEGHGLEHRRAVVGAGLRPRRRRGPLPMDQGRARRRALRHPPRLLRGGRRRAERAVAVPDPSRCRLGGTGLHGPRHDHDRHARGQRRSRRRRRAPGIATHATLPLVCARGYVSRGT